MPSDPAGSFDHSREARNLRGAPDLIPLGMGAISTGIAPIVDGEAALAQNRGACPSRPSSDPR
jgi:hypothetical protein